MARLFDNTQSEHLRCASPVVLFAPITMAAWVLPNSIYVTDVITVVSDESSYSNYWRLISNSTAGYVRFCANDGTESYAETTAAMGAGWNHVCGVEHSVSSRSAFVNRGNKGVNSDTRSPANVDVTGVGAHLDAGGNTLHWNGRIAEAAIWNAALTDLEVAAVGAGAPPFLIRPMSLRAYWPLLNDDKDWCGNYDMTPYNSPSWAVGPPMAFDWERRLYLYQRVALPLRMRLGVR